MGTIEPSRRKQIIENSDFYGVYENKIDDESAKELIEQLRNAEEEYEEEETVETDNTQDNNCQGPALYSSTSYKKADDTKTTTKETKATKKTTTKKKTSARSKKGYVSKKTDRLVNRTVSAVGTRLGNKIFKSLFK